MNFENQQPVTTSNAPDYAVPWKFIDNWIGVGLLNRRYRITGTPTIIVNGKYVTDVGMAGGEEKLFEVINALVAKEASRR